MNEQEFKVGQYVRVTRYSYGGEVYDRNNKIINSHWPPMEDIDEGIITSIDLRGSRPLVVFCKRTDKNSTTKQFRFYPDEIGNPHNIGERKVVVEILEEQPISKMGKADKKSKKLDCTREEFMKLVSGYCESLSTLKDEKWITDQEMAEQAFAGFIEFFWKDIEKEQRRKQYLELKKVFE